MMITTHEELMSYLKKNKYIKSPLIRDAFSSIDRKEFVPENLKKVAYFDNPLPLGLGQTISQPSTVAFMLELLRPIPGDKILDVGSGSGWQSALLAHVVRSKNKKGMITAVERIDDLLKKTEQNVEKFGFMKSGAVITILADATKKSKPLPLYDKIIVAASSDKENKLWVRQLKEGGRLVMPIKNSIYLFVKKDKDNITKKEYPGFSFVPLVVT